MVLSLSLLDFLFMGPAHKQKACLQLTLPSQSPLPLKIPTPTTHLSLHDPFDLPIMLAATKSSSSSSSSGSTVATSIASSATPAGTPDSRGQLHLKLISARALNIRSVYARPYVVVEFEQNEFVSRDPTDEDDRELRGTATTISRNVSFESRASAASSARIVHPPAPSIPSVRQVDDARQPLHQALAAQSGLEAPGLVDSVITFNLYDRAAEDHGFLGTLQIKPALVHDHTVDQWYKLKPVGSELVTGEIRVQITYEQYKTKHALTPRDFEFLKLIGRGTFGKVFQVRKKDTRRIFAMKVLSKKEIVAKKEVAHTIGERKILQYSLSCPFLVGLKFSFQTDQDLYLVTDFKSGGELFWHLQRETRFTEERAKFYIAELILALEHLHKYNIVYRDLKPENILLDATGHVALCDFGLSKADLQPNELTTTFCGTTEYLAPEILLDEHGYGKIVDFWSLGVLLFEMCCGWSPFYAEDTQQMYKNICFGKIRFPKGVIGEEGKLFVKGLLNRNPKNRLGAQRDAEELKEHAFFSNIDWKALGLKQVTPPFIPVVESDESTNNFDPEFTGTDVRDVGLPKEYFDAPVILNDDDPSEDWVSQSLAPADLHNGPLGWDSKPGASGPAYAALSSISHNISSYGTTSGRTSPKTKSIQIQPNRKRKDDWTAGSPLTRSMQENFRGFTYSGESYKAPMAAHAARHGVDTNTTGSPSSSRYGTANGGSSHASGVDLASSFGGRRRRSSAEKKEEAVDDLEVPLLSTAEEAADCSKPAGRLAHARMMNGGVDPEEELF
ncbi:hypothetical protein H1R20_g3436, partial [Candolleomyces eurysporus]